MDRAWERRIAQWWSDIRSHSVQVAEGQKLRRNVDYRTEELERAAQKSAVSQEPTMPNLHFTRKRSTLLTDPERPLHPTRPELSRIHLVRLTRLSLRKGPISPRPKTLYTSPFEPAPNLPPHGVLEFCALSDLTWKSLDYDVQYSWNSIPDSELNSIREDHPIHICIAHWNQTHFNPNLGQIHLCEEKSDDNIKGAKFAIYHFGTSQNLPYDASQYDVSGLDKGTRSVEVIGPFGKIRDGDPELKRLSLTRPALQRIHPMQLDISDDAEVISQKIDEAAKVWGRIDVIVNNAVDGQAGLLEEGGSGPSFDDYAEPALIIILAVLPHMRAQRSGTVVTVGSRMFWASETPGVAFYSAAKAAVHAFTEALMTELAPFNIRVLLVAPGAFRTEGVYGNPFFPDNPIPDYDDFRKRCIDRIESIKGNQSGDPDKAAKAIVDVVRGEGLAEGRPWPNYLILGRDAEADIRAKTAKLNTVLDKWSDITRGVEFDNA
ncbi:hypothetical protein CVT24_009033 [Panaeolus cyanescens]|uniref:Uncharacterized protein n=1 Tax=Panaeolus cyanescens TaxID=181874 RepID=A0A409WEK5_9AGAR|nr:hypothetical protein CVT24_009033 [Panaeolus cyanescens]